MRTIFKKSIIPVFLLFTFFSCSQDEPLVSLGLNDTYRIERMKALHLQPELSGTAYRWSTVNSAGEDSLLSEERNLVFLAEKPGTYPVTCEIADGGNSLVHSMKIVVIEELVAYSPYIARVFEYRPAPGQFINKLPEYKPGDTEKEMIHKAELAIAGNNRQTVSLGSFGGYITFGFDHTVLNLPEKYDFKIDGNAFVEQSHPNDGRSAGSSEPGIVMVSFDANNNGIPDDEWFELAGSEYYKPETQKNYEITYHKPDPGKPEVPGSGSNASITDMTYIPWNDNRGEAGYVYKNNIHLQSYWPLWLDDFSALAFQGTRLKDNAVDESEQQDGTLFIQYSYPWGYADNLPNSVDKGFNIEWAVDKNGNPVHLRGIDFVRVYTGINQYNGWKGETSTEILGARDLHVK